MAIYKCRFCGYKANKETRPEKCNYCGKPGCMEEASSAEKILEEI
jgi:hypothetical protein